VSCFVALGPPTPFFIVCCDPPDICYPWAFAFPLPPFSSLLSLFLLLQCSRDFRPYFFLPLLWMKLFQSLLRPWQEALFFLPACFSRPDSDSPGDLHLSSLLYAILPPTFPGKSVALLRRANSTFLVRPRMNINFFKVGRPCLVSRNALFWIGFTAVFETALQDTISLWSSSVLLVPFFTALRLRFF